MRHIPNVLSAFRIVLIPLFVWQMMAGNTTAAGVVLLVSGATDFFDGFLARRFGWVSDVGKVLDPIADKATQAAVSVCLAIWLRSYWPFFVLLLFKDFVMVTLGGYLMAKGVKLEGARWFGKVSTFVFYGTMLLIVFIPDMPQAVTIVLLSLATVCAFVSAAMYIPQFLHYRASTKKAEPKK